MVMEIKLSISDSSLVATLIENYDEGSWVMNESRVSLRDLSVAIDAADNKVIDAWFEDGKMLARKLDNIRLKPKKSTGKKSLQVQWKCPIDLDGCTENCGAYGCGN